MNYRDANAALLEVLNTNPSVQAAWLDHATNPPTLNLLTAHPPVAGSRAVHFAHTAIPIQVPAAFRALPYQLRQHDKLETLRLPVPAGFATNQHQECQDEPIHAGCQVQPAGAPWVGTYGLPVQWLDATGKPHWGALSNWHVFCTDHAKKGYPQHQPLESAPPFALLADWNSVTAAAPNYLDAAIADTLVNGLHTNSPDILGIGRPSDHYIDAALGLGVIKAGRTTGVTRADCDAVGAAVKVSYGDFTATFVDQDIFADRDGSFSAPGDSGSAILGANCLCPCSLLFAGGGKLTVGCPMRYAADRFNLVFPFN